MKRSTDQRRPQAKQQAEETEPNQSAICQPNRPSPPRRSLAGLVVTGVAVVIWLIFLATLAFR